MCVGLCFILDHGQFKGTKTGGRTMCMLRKISWCPHMCHWFVNYNGMIQLNGVIPLLVLQSMFPLVPSVGPHLLNAHVCSAGTGSVWPVWSNAWCPMDVIAIWWFDVWDVIGNFVQPIVHCFHCMLIVFQTSDLDWPHFVGTLSIMF